MSSRQSSENQLSGTEIPRPLAGTTRISERVRILARRANIRHIMVLALSALVAISVFQAVGRARYHSDQLGTRAPVLVAEADIRAGDRLNDTNTSISHWPVGLIPANALTGLVGEEIAIHSLGPGEPITGSDTVDAGGLLAEELGVVVPLYLPLDGFSVGDHLEVFAVLPIGTDHIVAASASSLGPARLVSMTDSSATIALRSRVVPLVLEAMATGSIELVRSPS